MYKYLTEVKDIRLNNQVIGLDVETDGLNPRSDNLLLIQLSDGQDTYILDARVLPAEYIISAFSKYRKNIFVSHNAKFDLGFLYSKYGILLDNIHDTMLAESVLFAGLKPLMVSLKNLVAERFNISLDKSLQSSFLTPSREFSQEQLEYASQDAEVLIKLYYEQMKEITEGGFSNVMSLENKLVNTVMKMEHFGIKLSPERLMPVISDLEIEAESHLQELYRIAGREFNPRSYKQVLEVFHELAVKDKCKALRVASTGYDVIKTIKHPIIDHLLGYRGAFKLVSTYGVKLLEKIENDGRIHSNFNQYGAQSGRFSSSSQNLQNIPSDPKFRHPFVADEGYKFITADYSQIELRVAGITSGEEEILSEYRKDNPDLHSKTAAKIFGISAEEVTKEQRSHGKTGNFSTMYGTSSWSLAKKQDIPEDLAERIVNGFWNGYPTLARHRTMICNQVIRDKFSRTPLGRIRYFEMPSSRDPAFKYKLGAIQREGFNHTIQGFAADIMKYAMIRLDNDLGNKGRILLTVHDEVGVEVKEEYAEECVTLIKESMEKSAGILVNNVLPMTVEPVLMDSWTK